MRIPTTAGDGWSEQKRDNSSVCVGCSESFALSQVVLVFTDASGLVEVSSLNTSVGKVDLLEQVERGFIVKLAGAKFDLWDRRVEQHSWQLALMYAYVTSYTRLLVECEI